MKALWITAFGIILSNVGFSQTIEELSKEEVRLIKIKSYLTDSIRKIEEEISKIKNKRISVSNNHLDSDSSFLIVDRLTLAGTGVFNHPKGNQIGWITDHEKILITEIYDTDFVKIRSLEKATTGYVSIYALQRTPELATYIRTIGQNKEKVIWDEESRLNKEKLDEINRVKTEFENARKSDAKKKRELRLKLLIFRFGEYKANMIIDGQYWLGMTSEEATESLGKPHQINKDVGAWGVHSQWVYSGLYLYFENGILKSYQER